MKTTILLTAFLVSSIISSASPQISIDPTPKVKTTADPIFSAFRAHRQGNGITTMWFSNATPSNVSCFTVIRTYEDPTDPYSEWTVVGSANCNSARNYKSTEQNVSPGFVSYRIVASLVGGGYAYSDVETVHIVQH